MTQKNNTFFTKDFLIKILPLLVLFSVWFAFASPYFLKGKVPYPSSYQVNHFPPWSSIASLWGPVKNGAMPDIISQIYPWKYFAINVWKSGVIPLWNPYSFSGSPHLANYQSAVFFPFNFLYVVLSFIDAWSIIVLSQPLLAGVFMFLFLRELKMSRAAATVGSIAFMFCGFIVVWMAYGTLSMAIAFLPLSCFAIERIFTKKSIIYFLILAISIAISFFSGHFQTSLYHLFFVFAFLTYKAIQTKNSKKIFFAIAALTLGIILALPQLIPSAAFYNFAVRSEIFIKGGGIPFYYLVNLFSPDFYGNPVTRNDWFGFYAEWASFVGIIPLQLAVFGFFQIKKRNVILFIIMLIVTALLAIDSFTQPLLGTLKIPVLATSNPSRIIVLVSFCLSVLAGFGYDNLKELVDKKNLKKLLVGFGVISLLLLLIWISLILLKTLPFDKIAIAKRNMVIPTILFTATVGIAFAGVFLRQKIIKSSILTVLILLTAFDSFRFAQKWMPFDPKNLVFIEEPVISAMKKNIGNSRVFGNLEASIYTYYSIPSIEGYDPLYIGRYGEFIQSASGGNFQEAQRSVVRLDRNGKYTNRVLDFLGVNLIFHPIADTNQSWAYSVWEDHKRFERIYKDSLFELYKNTMAMDRAKVFFDFEVIRNKKELLKRFYSDNFDYRKTLLLEKHPGINPAKPATGSAKILLYTPNKIIIEAKTNSPGILLLTDNYYPGWKAKVNGQEVKIYQADYTFRAIVVPVGKSKVEFYYLF